MADRFFSSWALPGLFFCSLGAVSIIISYNEKLHGSLSNIVDGGLTGEALKANLELAKSNSSTIMIVSGVFIAGLIIAVIVYILKRMGVGVGRQSSYYPDMNDTVYGNPAHYSTS